MTAQLWTDDTRVHCEAGFLVRRDNLMTGVSKYHLTEHPQHTNRSHRPMLHGWCGTENDVAYFACGLARVVKTAATGRVRLKRLPATLEQLSAFGYPELASQA